MGLQNQDFEPVLGLPPETCTSVQFDPIHPNTQSPDQKSHQMTGATTKQSL